mmetsp:Transcript_13999/g.25373  ORF Transcript_13999/g.25373 Transcript_13999/m.25373 type:complete len:208 (-) Transcript_13999:1457-2080(-)
MFPNWVATFVASKMNSAEISLLEAGLNLARMRPFIVTWPKSPTTDAEKSSTAELPSMKKFFLSQRYTIVTVDFDSFFRAARRAATKEASATTSLAPVSTCSVKVPPLLPCTIFLYGVFGRVKLKLSSRMATHRFTFVSFLPLSFKNSSITRNRTSLCSISLCEACRFSNSAASRCDTSSVSVRFNSSTYAFLRRRVLRACSRLRSRF